MKKNYSVKTLKRIKEIQGNYRKLKALGVDLIDYENGVSLLVESIVIMCVGEKDFESALNDVQWWLYEKVEKVIIVKRKKYNVENPEAFIDWLINFYKNK